MSVFIQSLKFDASRNSTCLFGTQYVTHQQLNCNYHRGAEEKHSDLINEARLIWLLTRCTISPQADGTDGLALAANALIQSTVCLFKGVLLENAANSAVK